MADAQIGHQCKFQRYDGAGFAAVGQIIDIKPPSVSREVVEATHYESVDRFEEVISAMRDAGEVSFTIQFSDPAALDDLHTDIKSDAAVDYKFIWNNALATEWEFSGFVTEVTPSTPLKDRMTADVTIRVSGKPTFLS